MANPIFGRQETALGGAFSADMTSIQFGNGVSGVLVQSMNGSYQQAVMRLFELAGPNNGMARFYYVVGRTSGSASLSRVLGPHTTITALYSAFGNICNARDNTMTLDISQSSCASSEGGQTSTGKLKYEFKYCALQAVGFGIQAEQMLLQETSNLMFSGCNYA